MARQIDIFRKLKGYSHGFYAYATEEEKKAYDAKIEMLKAKISQWIRADTGNDYTTVLIKKGTWQSDELLYELQLSGSKKKYAGINLSKTKTKIVIGEAGSKIYFQVDPTSALPIYGLY